MSGNGVGEKAAAYFDSGLLCAESVFKALCEARGVGGPELVRLATGMCSGFARTRQVCGALSGAVLAAGLLHGRSEAGVSHLPCYERTSEIVELFREKFGGTGCYELIECDFTTPEGQRKFHDNNVKAERCRAFVAFAADMADDVL